MIERIKQYIEKHKLISYGDSIVIAFSGGPDSVYLMEVLLDLKEQWNLQLAAVYINHQLLDEAQVHAAFVKEYCEDKEVPLYYFEKDIGAYAKQGHMSVEEAGRKFRYEKFYEVKEKLGYTSIAVAHHQNDKAETVLYRMARGTGWKGMAAIRPKQNDLIRPLLCITKEEILQKLAGCQYNIDPSNEDVVYARNQIRHRVLPELCKVNGQAMEHITDLAEQMEELGSYLEHEIEKVYNVCIQKTENGNDIFLENLAKAPVFLQKEVLKKVLEETSGSHKNLARIHIEQLYGLFDSQSGKKVDLPYGIKGIKQYDKILLRKAEKENDPQRILLEKDGVYEVKFANGRIKMQIFSGNTEEFSRKMYTKTFDYDKIKNHIIVRTWEKEDFFVMNGEGKKKRLNRYFIDQKIPGEQRGFVPLVADGNHIIWIIGGRISEAYKITKHTKTILKLTWIPMEEE